MLFELPPTHPSTIKAVAILHKAVYPKTRRVEIPNLPYFPYRGIHQHAKELQAALGGIPRKRRIARNCWVIELLTDSGIEVFP